jgi:moderate conductance mechanosensitive channel
MELSALFDPQALRETVLPFALAVSRRALGAGLIVVTALVAGRILSSAAARMLHDQRGGTLVPITKNGIRSVAIAIGVVMALDHIGVDVRTLLAGAGIVGIAVGFGAQSLVKDLISGFFLLLEDVVRVGDVATVGETTGTVEQVGLRMTLVRTFNGQLWYIPNGEIKTVGNFNRGWSRAVVEVPVAYEGDVAQALRVLKQVGDSYMSDHPGQLVESPVAEGVLAFNSSDLTLRLIARAQPNSHWPVERELRKRVKEAFDREGIEIPYPRQVALVRERSAFQPRSNSPAADATAGSE